MRGSPHCPSPSIGLFCLFPGRSETQRRPPLQGGERNAELSPMREYADQMSRRKGGKLLSPETGVRVALSSGSHDKTSGREGRKAGRRIELAVATRPVLVRDVLSRLLDTVPGLRVVGSAADEDQIRSILSKLRPAVLLFDYEAMGPNGEGIVSRLRRASPATRILVIASRSADENVEQVLRAGASGLVGKQLDFAVLVRAIHAVAAGELWANRRAAAQAMESMVGLAARVPALDGHLTKREWEIADGVSQGLRNKEIAARLSISEKTVKSHLNNVFSKLKISGRIGLLTWAQAETHPKT
jgi:DNA-binding NarL/FixJ family response regulator